MLDNYKKMIHSRIKTYFDKRLGSEISGHIAGLEGETERLTRMVGDLLAQHRHMSESFAIEKLHERKRVFGLYRRFREKMEIPPVPPPVYTKTIEECFLELERLAPAAFMHWKGLFETNREAYVGFPTHSCSVRGHPMAELFQAFLTPYLAGRVLDIGCGPQSMPWYLHGCRHSHLAGIDPLPPSEGDHPFVFHQGLTEFLPWQDGVFDTVVAATSLDHVLLLDRALGEIQRVMASDGILIVWVAFIPGAQPYDPYQEGIKPVDAYHLFHFDRPWFEDVIKSLFTIEEDIHLATPGISSFYALTPKEK